MLNFRKGGRKMKEIEIDGPILNKIGDIDVD